MPLSRWTAPLSRWLHRGSVESPAPVPVPPAPAKPTPAPPAPNAPDSELPWPDVQQALFVAWLLGREASAGVGSGLTGAAPTDSRGAALLRHLDVVIASEPLRRKLLPRAPQVVPQLMKSLRDDNYSAADVAVRVSKDVVLATEIVRLANLGRHAGGEPVVDLRHAIDALGTAGLQRAISKVLLRPIFEVRGDSLSARAAPQIWKDADAKAQLCAAFAASAALDPLDAYLAGLLHNAGWSAALRALDGAQPPPSAAGLPLTPAFVDALVRRRDALFGALVRPWDLSPALLALADEVGSVGLAAASSPFGQALRLAERLAARHVLERRGVLPPGAEAPFEALPTAVRRCYAGLTAA